MLVQVTPKLAQSAVSMEVQTMEVGFIYTIVINSLIHPEKVLTLEFSFIKIKGHFLIKSDEYIWAFKLTVKFVFFLIIRAHSNAPWMIT